VILQPADVVLVHGVGWLARAIRWATRSRGEPRTWVSHVALAVDGTNIVEAIGRGAVERRLEGAYPRSRVRVYRPTRLTETERLRIVLRAESHVGEPYGYWRLALHGLDALLGIRFFRNFATVRERPICSWIVAESYGLEGYTFGVDASAADPDQIADFVASHPDLYERLQ
jgi:hypothetical protein